MEKEKKKNNSKTKEESEKLKKTKKQTTSKKRNVKKLEDKGLKDEKRIADEVKLEKNDIETKKDDNQENNINIEINKDKNISKWVVVLICAMLACLLSFNFGVNSVKSKEIKQTKIDFQDFFTGSTLEGEMMVPPTWYYALDIDAFVEIDDVDRIAATKMYMNLDRNVSNEDFIDWINSVKTEYEVETLSDGKYLITDTEANSYIYVSHDKFNKHILHLIFYNTEKDVVLNVINQVKEN